MTDTSHGLHMSESQNDSDKDLVPGPIDTSKWFAQDPRLVVNMARASGRNKDHHDE